MLFDFKNEYNNYDLTAALFSRSFIALPKPLSGKCSAMIISAFSEENALRAANKLDAAS
jgi:hypothetical protein